MANGTGAGIDWNAVLGGEGGFAQATRGFQSPTNPEGIDPQMPWYKNMNLLGSVLGQVGTALDPEGVMAPVGQLGAEFGQSNLMEMARKKKEDENRQMMQYMVGLLGGQGGFTPPDQAGPTKLTADANKMSLDVTPGRAISSDELSGSGFNAPTPARNVSGFDVPTANTKVGDLQNILPF